MLERNIGRTMGHRPPLNFLAVPTCCSCTPLHCTPPHCIMTTMSTITTMTIMTTMTAMTTMTIMTIMSMVRIQVGQ